MGILKTYGGGFNFSKMSLRPNPKKENEQDYGRKLNVVGGTGSGEGEGGLFLRFRLVYIPILSHLLSLESLEKFVWWWRFQRLYGEVPEIIWCVNLF